MKEGKCNDDEFQIIADPKDAVIIERLFFKHTQLDLEIQNLPIPTNPKWLFAVVRLIRYYQKCGSPKLGNRCVFDPSCSRYSEMAFRKKGFFKGAKLTLKRLNRCRPANGGKDVLN